MIKTHCDKCLFANRKDGVQIGCTLNRDKKLGVEKVENNSFLLQRFCNTYRPQAWLDNLDFEQSMNPEAQVLKEVMPRIGFFVRLDTKLSNAIEHLEKTLKSISSINEVEPAYVVVITDKVEYNEEVWALFLQLFGEESKTKYHIVQCTYTTDQVFSLIDEAFTHAQNGWLMTLSSGESVDEDIILKLNKTINVDMRQVTLVRNVDEFTMLFPAYIFKFLNGGRSKIFSDEVVDSDSFVAKMEKAEKRGGTKTIITWEEFNAS
jgi:hypothetical protein